METIAEELWHTRCIVTPDLTGKVTQKKVRRSVAMANCVLERMGILPTDKPMNGVSKTVWEENNKTRGTSIRVKFEDYNETYSYQENLHGYVLDKRWDSEINYLWQLSRHEKYQVQLGWLMESYKAKHPEKNFNNWDEIKESWKAHVTEMYFGQPLECPRWEDGSCMKTFEGLTKEDFDQLREALADKKMDVVKEIRSKGRDCLLVRPAAQTVTDANQMMFDDDKGEIYPMTCYRSNESQAIMLSIIAPDEIAGKNGELCKLVQKTKSDVQNPGGSNHGMGLAMDVYNWNESEPYLSLAGGWLCNFVGNKFGRLTMWTGIGHGSDQGHCSVAEKAPTADVLDHKKIVEGKLKASSAWDTIKKLRKNRGSVLGK